MAIPDYQTLMLPVLKALSDREEHRSIDLVDRMAEVFRLTAEEIEQLVPSGRKTIIADRTNWAITYLAKTRLVERTRRAHVRITERGLDILAENPDRVDLKLLSRFPELKAFMNARRPKEESNGGVEDSAPEPQASVEAAAETPDELIRTASARIDAALREDLLERILQAPPAFFERLIVQLLLAMGFGGGKDSTAQAIGRSGDGGLDGVIDQDPIGLDRVYLQAKRYGRDNSVGSNAIRDFFGSLDIVRAGKGVFMTTSSFTKNARDTAERLGKRIVLIDGDELGALMIRYDVGVRIEETFRLKKIDEDFFSE